MIESLCMPKFKLKPIIIIDNDEVEHEEFILQERHSFLGWNNWKNVLYNSGPEKFNTIIGTREELVEKIKHLSNHIYVSE